MILELPGRGFDPCGSRPKRDLRRSTSTARRAWAYWFKQAEYYQVAAVYALTRLICNVSQVRTPVPCSLALAILLWRDAPVAVQCEVVETTTAQQG